VVSQRVLGQGQVWLAEVPVVSIDRSLFVGQQTRG
jgi:hypothetical protein